VLSGAEQIVAFTLLPTEWSVAGSELTPTLKLKRSVITRKYAEASDTLYA
jgi:long-chain acyl-CoA synthetase